MGLLARLGRRSSSGATPGETPRVNPATVARANDRGTLAGGVLAADRGLIGTGLGGPGTVQTLSRYPGAADPLTRSEWGPGSTPWHSSTRGRMVDSDASAVNPPYPSRDPAGPSSGRGRLSGGAWASEAGPVERGPGELVNLRYLPIDPRITDPHIFARPVNETQGYRPGRMIVSYYVRPQRDFGTEPFLNGAHGAIRATPYVSPPPPGQLPHGSAQPTVYRPTPLPWDTGVIRGVTR